MYNMYTFKMESSEKKKAFLTCLNGLIRIEIERKFLYHIQFTFDLEFDVSRPIMLISCWPMTMCWFRRSISIFNDGVSRNVLDQVVILGIGVYKLRCAAPLIKYIQILFIPINIILIGKSIIISGESFDLKKQYVYIL